MEMGLAVPLTMSQIEAANRLHRKLLQWKATDNALCALKERFPGFDVDSSLLKVAAIDQLYGTNVYAVVRMVEHVTEVMCQVSTLDDVELVGEIATLANMKHTSFASKFAHFFIDEERFPIYDSYAVKMVEYHPGKQVLVRDTDNQGICGEFSSTKTGGWIGMYDERVRSLFVAGGVVSEMESETGSTHWNRGFIFVWFAIL